MVTHLLGWPGQLSAFSSSSIAPFFFFNFFTNESTAFSAHFSSSSPCFQPSSRFTAGLVNENSDVMDVVECIGTKCSKVLEGIGEGCAASGVTVEEKGLGLQFVFSRPKSSGS